MIYIDNSDIRLPPGWQQKATKLTRNMATMTPKAKSSCMAKNQKMWHDLKDELSRLSYKKCWYCESKLGRFHSHVDHFRPKNRVNAVKNKKFNGYWWLAFNYRNYRLACQFCNCKHQVTNGITRGKGDQFPLLDDSKRAITPRDRTEREEPLLLDPTVAKDPTLLWFEDTGRIRAKNKKVIIENKRVKATIKILDLNEGDIVEERLQKILQCEDLYMLGNEIFAKWKKSPAKHEKAYKHVLTRINALVQPNSEFSACARSYFIGTGEKWVLNAIK